MEDKTLSTVDACKKEETADHSFKDGSDELAWDSAEERSVLRKYVMSLEYPVLS